MADWFCQVSGQQYGPVAEAELRQWLAQGRLKPTDLVWREGMSGWVPASSVLASAAPPPTPGAPAYVPPPPRSAPAMQGPRQHMEPHRGTIVLVLGIVGLVVCFICGIIAWVMGSRDLAKMRAGTMDPSGEGNTRAGMICGMISTILAAVGLVFWIISIAVWLAGR